MRRVTLWAAAAILLGLWAACYSEPLAIPDPSKIEYLEVVHFKKTENRDEEGLSRYRIIDRQRIEAFVRRLKALNVGFRAETEWNQRLGLVDFSTGAELMIDLFEPGQPYASLHVSIGPDWLSGLDGKLDKNGQPLSYRKRKLGGSEQQELAALVVQAPGDPSD